MSTGSRPSSSTGHPGRGGPSSSTSRRVIVSLEFLPHNTSVQAPITNEFSSHLPLNDLQWKSSSRSTTRTIETLNLDFRPFRESVKDNQLQQIPINLLERPYLHLLFVASDDNEAYRTTLRPQIREWLNAVQSRKLQEWLIVHVTSQKTGPAKFYQRKGSVFDKIRADFNVSKRDRVLQLPVPGSQADENVTDYSTIWREFLAKAKESIVLSFDGNFTSYEEDVRKIDSQRMMPGWNFCTFFIQKEGLAHSFEAMNLLEDALIQYDELEASYYLGAKDQTVPWFSRIGGTMEQDDSISILSSSGKQYRHLIMQNDITVFDFRIYLFARQASLVAGLGRIVDLVKRAKAFIYSMARLLRAHHGLLRRYFIETWIYTATLEVVDKTHDMLNARKMNAAAIPDLLPTLAELLELATRQVEKLGMSFGYLPRTHPFLMSVQSMPVDGDEKENGNGHDSPDSPGHLECSNVELQNSFTNEAAFDAMYRQLLDRVHEAWSGSMRTRNADKIKGTLAALEQARRNTKRSLDIYTSLARHFSQTHWLSIEAQLLRQTTALREGATQPNEQTERLLSVLALVRTGLEAGSLRWTLGTRNKDGAELANSLLTEARSLSKQLDKDFAVIDVPAFSVALGSSTGGFMNEEDGISLLLIVTNHLPCPIDVDEVRVKLLSMSDEPLWLKSEATHLAPGRNEIQASALVSLVGTYALETSQIRTSRIVFQHSHRPPNHRQEHLRTGLATSKQALVVFTQDPHAIDLSTEESESMSVDQPREAILVITPGRQQVTKATIHFPGASSKVAFIYETARCIVGECSVTANPQERSISLSSIANHDVIKIAIQYHSLVPSQHVLLNATVDYHTTVRPEKRRILKTCIRLRTALPLDVNVHDYRRDKFILSKFTVSTKQRLPLRVKDATLANTKRFTASPACRNRAKAVVIRRDQPGSFPFRLERQDIETRSDENSDETQEVSSKLNIQFISRTIEAELRAVLSPHLSTLLAKHKVQPSRRMVEAISSHFVADNSIRERFNDISTLDALGKADFTLGQGHDVDVSSWWSTCQHDLRSYWTNIDEWDRIRAAIVEVFQTLIPTGLLVNEPWQTVTIPFEIPTTAIFNRVSLQFTTRDQTYNEIGQQIACTLQIHSSFDWASSTDRAYFNSICDTSNNPSEDEQNIYGKGQRMLYEIQAKAGDWIVAGKTRAEFYISNAKGANLQFPLALIPLRAGKLFLPTISVHPLPALRPDRSQKLVEQDANEYDNLPTCETYQQDAATYVEVVDGGALKTELKFSTQTGEVEYLIAA